MLDIVRFRKKDLLEIDIAEDQGIMKDYQSEELAEELEAQERLYTFFNSGKIVGIGGLIDRWEGRAEALLLKAKSVSLRDLVEIRRFALNLIDTSPHRRVEATISVDDSRLDWIKSLGFKQEGYMEAFGIDGKDHVLYAKVKKWERAQF